ncbi:unnamed protein product [Effrenium voratum]|nr:unnamed protein product [Effrenium voratum]
MASRLARRHFAPLAVAASAAWLGPWARKVSCEAKSEAIPSRFRTSLYRLDENLWKAGQALRPGMVTTRFKPGRTHVIRIVLTGGPCAGKSSALEHLTRAATAAGYDVYAAPEVCTVLLNAGMQFPEPGCAGYEDRWLAIQTGVMQMQLQLERSMTDIAASTGRPSIIIFDRGLLDGRAYVPAHNWAKLVGQVEASAAGLDKPRKLISEEYMLARYNMIVHLTSAADGAEEYYKWGKTVDDSGHAVIRGEPPEKARELDHKLRDCWRQHPRWVLIHNGPDGFKGKLQRATDSIMKLASEIHPQGPKNGQV